MPGSKQLPEPYLWQIFRGLAEVLHVCQTGLTVPKNQPTHNNKTVNIALPTVDGWRPIVIPDIKLRERGPWPSIARSLSSLQNRKNDRLRPRFQRQQIQHGRFKESTKNRNGRLVPTSKSHPYPLKAELTRTRNNIIPYQQSTPTPRLIFAPISSMLASLFCPSWRAATYTLRMAPNGLRIPLAGMGLTPRPSKTSCISVWNCRRRADRR
jgi:hypothetical protein